MRLGGQQIQIVTRTPGAKDSLGVPTATESTVQWQGCFIQPLETDETLGNVDTVISHYKLFAPGEPPLTSTGRVLSDGISYEVRGDPMVWRGINGAVHHVECYLRRATG